MQRESLKIKSGEKAVTGDNQGTKNVRNEALDCEDFSPLWNWGRDRPFCC